MIILACNTISAVVTTLIMIVILISTFRIMTLTSILVVLSNFTIEIIPELSIPHRLTNDTSYIAKPSYAQLRGTLLKFFPDPLSS